MLNSVEKCLRHCNSQTTPVSRHINDLHLCNIACKELMIWLVSRNRGGIETTTQNAEQYIPKSAFLIIRRQHIIVDSILSFLFWRHLDYITTDRVAVGITTASLRDGIEEKVSTVVHNKRLGVGIRAATICSIHQSLSKCCIKKVVGKRRGYEYYTVIVDH